jgi:hypothetical protein
MFRRAEPEPEKKEKVEPETVHEQLDEVEKAVAAVHDRLREMERCLCGKEKVLKTKMDNMMDLLRSMDGKMTCLLKETEVVDMKEKKEDIRGMVEGLGDIVEAGVTCLSAQLTEVGEQLGLMGDWQRITTDLLKDMTGPMYGYGPVKFPTDRTWEPLEPSVEDEIEGKVVRRRDQLPATLEYVKVTSRGRGRRRRNREPPRGGTQ